MFLWDDFLSPAPPPKRWLSKINNYFNTSRRGCSFEGTQPCPVCPFPAACLSGQSPHLRCVWTRGLTLNHGQCSPSSDMWRPWSLANLPEMFFRCILFFNADGHCSGLDSCLSSVLLQSAELVTLVLLLLLQKYEFKLQLGSNPSSAQSLLHNVQYCSSQPGPCPAT